MTSYGARIVRIEVPDKDGKLDNVTTGGDSLQTIVRGDAYGGATIGRLNEDELFYMRTRGIPAAEARILQQKAFAYEVLEKISNTELRERMLSLVERRLRGEFSHCSTCIRNCC